MLAGTLWGQRAPTRKRASGSHLFLLSSLPLALPGTPLETLSAAPLLPFCAAAVQALAAAEGPANPQPNPLHLQPGESPKEWVTQRLRERLIAGTLAAVLPGGAEAVLAGEEAPAGGPGWCLVRLLFIQTSASVGLPPASKS